MSEYQRYKYMVYLIAQLGTLQKADISTSEQLEEDDEDSHFVEKEDESCQVSENTPKCQKSCNTKTRSNINREILEDWEEDTDSQQSDKQNTPKDNNHQEETESDNSKDGHRQAAVDKLMTDWEDEEEEDKKDQ